MKHQQVESQYLNYILCKLNLRAQNYSDVYFKKLTTMADNKLSADEILKHFGDYESLSLENVIDGSEDENEINLFNPSPYYLIEDLPYCLKKEGHLNILSLNTQSINAKFDSILALLKIAQLQNIKFHVICIQETLGWTTQQTCLCFK